MKQYLKRIFRSSFAFLLIFVLEISSLQWVAASGSLTVESADELVIKLAPNKTIDQVLRKYNVSMAEFVESLGLYRIKLPQSIKKEDLLMSLNKDALVAYCQPNYKYMAAYTPNDPNYDVQWGIPKIKLDQAWNTITEKNSIPVAMIDTGINTAHPDLAGQVFSGYNTIANSTNIYDDNGHGTHVAGIAAAITNNGTGISGVAGKAYIIPIKALDSKGSGYTADICEGIAWAADHGAKIINLSMAGPNNDPLLQEAIDYAYNKGAMIIAAAGNSNVNTSVYPAAANHVIAVSAIDSNNNKAGFSNYGSYIDLAAPGVNIYSTTKDGKYGYMSGTSMASSFAAGAAAYIWSLDTTLTAAQVEQTLYSTAENLGVSGKDTFFGYGLIDLYKAVKTFSQNTQNPPPPTTPNTPPTTPYTPPTTPDTLPSTPDTPPATTETPDTTPVSGTDLPPIGDIDTPVDMEPISGAYNVTGWFLDDDPFLKLDILVDNQVIGQAIYGASRPDIASKYANYNNKNCGFRFNLDTNRFSSGSHLLVARETSTKGAQNTLPAVRFYIADKASFSNKVSNIIYYLSEDAKVTIGIYDCKGTLVRVLESNASKSAGLNSSQWDGRDSSGNIVRDGVYTYKIQAVDDAGFASTPATGTIIVERLNPEISLVSDSPDPIFPQKGITSVIKYTLSEDAVVTMDIFDENNKLVRNLDSTSVCFGENQSVWDGKDNSGTFVNTGTYRYVINATDAFGKNAKTATGSITVTSSTQSLKPPVISNNVVSPDNLTPDGVKHVTITYTLSESAAVTVSIYNSSNVLVNTLESAVSKNAGGNACVWNGSDRSNAFVPAGSYTYRIAATNSAGLSAVPAAGIIKINAAAKISISLIGDSPDPFMPSIAKVNTIEYILSKDAEAKVSLFNSSGIQIKTLFTGQVSAGLNQATWDGKDASGVFAADGTYSYKITAVDATGIAAEPVYGSITVSAKKKPLIISVSDTPDPFDPAANSLNTITYLLNENALINLEIRDGNGKLIKTLVNGNVNSGSNSTNWDGKDTNGSFVPAGLYTYTISAKSSTSSEVGQSGGTITVSKQADKPGDKPGDNTSPLIYSNTVSPNPFYVSGNNNTIISYSLSRAAKVTLTIFNGNAVPIKHIETDLQKSPGNYSASWDGTNDSRALESNGIYQYLIKATDLSGETASVSGEIMIVVPLKITSVSDSPDPFAPGNESDCDIRFTLSKDANVSLRIYDSAGTLIRTLINSKITGGANQVAWDGRNQSGTIVKDGKYTYKIEAADDSGNTATPVSGQITVDTAPPVITLNAINPNPYIISDSNAVTITYSLTKPARVNITIYDSKNSKVKVLENASAKAAGKNTAVWAGTDANDVPVIEGTYKIEIAAAGTSGMTSNSVSGIITVKYSVPVISWFNSTPDPFGADGTRLCTISYNISKKASVVIAVYDSNGKLVRTLLNNVKVNAGNNTVTWNGKNGAGTIVNSGVYTYTIDAADDLGNKAEQKKGILTLDSDPPELKDAKDDPDPFTPTE